MTITWRVPFGDLQRSHQALQAELLAAAGRVIASGWYILGAEVAGFEREFAALCGVAHCVGVASGAEALYLALAAAGVGPGDEVVTVANACMYDVAAILQAGARPVLVDVDPVTQTMDPAALAAAITPRTKAVIPVHLFGRLADMPAILAIAEQHGVTVIEDAAQAHGAWRPDAGGTPRMAGQWGHLAAFSFYPSKNLGALGDGGAVVTNHAEFAERLRRLRMYGWERKYYTTEAGGRNSRLDELQAALLRVKLPHLAAANEARRERAAWYAAALADLPVGLPVDEPGHVYHLYVITLADRATRDRLREHLLAHGIGCDVHYPAPTHLQPAYADLGYHPGSLPVTEDLAGRILSLPMYPELSYDDVMLVAETIRMGFV
ncbi:erythromycin biosynthesis sensory transduction protein eryC1 [Chloroflexus islandicus]|uniref:Erythromycin biosynthesis sensory transduction protein eryC1 n=1 Tax=Chloroflexus islandicus TaxID=1707952 RepID=A0A178MAX9_9CHLR|nr:DegT/DnrJ/EryC1/StrS family aminotransferase [Chloroflexus islandicus]OAN45941.1 erythromycin biosynthesis sensory transduction protein eryC1 [Chloroflexus islandicus]